MKTKHILIFGATAFLAIATLNSCGGKKEEVKEEEVKLDKNPFAALAKMGQDMQKGAEESQAQMKKRRERGDTLAMPYQDLQKFLPEAPSGYTAKEPDGSTVNMGGTSYSNAEVTFKKENGDWIKVQILDYNQAYGLFTAATSMWALGISVDSPQEKSNGVKFEGNIAGFESYKKKSKKAMVTLGVGSRFWVSVEAENQENTEFVKEMAKKIDLKKLSEL